VRVEIATVTALLSLASLGDRGEWRSAGRRVATPCAHDWLALLDYAAGRRFETGTTTQ
jgi:hypothetical protein